MKVKTWIEIAQEIEVDVYLADVMASLSQHAETDQPGLVADCVSQAYGVLKNLSDKQINLLSEEARAVVANALREQAERYDPK